MVQYNWLTTQPYHATQQPAAQIYQGKYSKYAKDRVYSAEGKNTVHAEEAVFAKEGHNKPLAKEGDDKPLAKDGDQAGYNNELLVTRTFGHVHHARRQ
jgi:hypothetical protein